MPTKREITAEAVTKFTSWYDGFLTYREDDDRWAVICTDNKWRLVHPWDFNEFISRWAAKDYWQRIPCGPDSEFRRIIETLMVGRPRLAKWKCDPFMRADDCVYAHCQINGLTQA